MNLIKRNLKSDQHSHLEKTISPPDNDIFPYPKFEKGKLGFLNKDDA